MDKWKKEDCVRCLRAKQEEVGRLPKKSDFDSETVNRIKGWFGPWPRALEAAGLKEPNRERAEKRREKRRRAIRNRIRNRREHPRPKENQERKEEK